MLVRERMNKRAQEAVVNMDPKNIRIGMTFVGPDVVDDVGPAEVNIQAPGLGVAASNRGLRSSVGRGVAVVGERGFRDDCGLWLMRCRVSRLRIRVMR